MSATHEHGTGDVLDAATVRLVGHERGHGRRAVAQDAEEILDEGARHETRMQRLAEVDRGEETGGRRRRVAVRRRWRRRGGGRV